MNRILSVFIFLLLALLPVSCGPYSFTGASIPPSVQTFTVETFQNQAEISVPTLGQNFTQALQEQFLQQTNLTLVEDGGDLRFAGSIVTLNTSPVGVTGDATAALTRLTMTVNVIFINTKEEDKDFETTFSAYADYESSRNLVEVQDVLLEQITQELVLRIFQRAVVNW